MKQGSNGNYSPIGSLLKLVMSFFRMDEDLEPNIVIIPEDNSDMTTVRPHGRNVFYNEAAKKASRKLGTVLGRGYQRQKPAVKHNKSRWRIGH
jgi:hypothetical protein